MKKHKQRFEHRIEVIGESGRFKRIWRIFRRFKNLMKIPQQILLIALANGWLGAHHPFSAEEPNLQGYVHVKYFKNGHDVTQGIPFAGIVIDPYFWEALGRGLYWKQDNRKPVEFLKMHQNGLKTLNYAQPLHDWQIAAHQCLHLILAGAPSVKWEEFWEEVLETKEE